MRRCATRCLWLLTLLVAGVGGCTRQKPPVAEKDTALSARIEQLVETFLTSDDDAKNAAVLAETRTIFEREGVPGVARVGEAAAYGFVLINMLGQAPDFRLQFFSGVREAANRRELPEDALAFAEARRRQTEVEQRYKAHTPSHPELRDRDRTPLQGRSGSPNERGIRPKEIGGGGPANCGPAQSDLRSIRRTDLRHGRCAGGE